MRSLFLGFFARRAGNHPLRGSPRKRQGCAWDGSSIPSPCSTRPAVSPDTLIWTLGCLVILAPYLLWQSRRRALRKARAESLALGLRPFFEREIPFFAALRRTAGNFSHRGASCNVGAYSMWIPCDSTSPSPWRKSIPSLLGTSPPERPPCPSEYEDCVGRRLWTF